ncbi:MAG TPA: hypothetical protein VIN06_11425 [Devosia sp.]
MRLSVRLLLPFIILAGADAVLADEARLSFGGDQYVAGQAAGVASPVERDAFVAGYDVRLGSPVTGDAHLAGFNVSTDAPVGGDLYAAGSSVNVTNTVGGDVTAFGNTIAVRPDASVAGNTRLAGASVTLSAPINGSALITAQTLTLDAPVAGDLNFFGENIVFGPAAKIAGKVIIQAPKEIAVPATVAQPNQVTFTQLVAPDYAGEAGKTAEHVVKSAWPFVWATGAWWLVLCVVGLLFITLGGRTTAALEAASEPRSLRTFGLGVLGFAATIGLVPVFALTMIGIFLLPFVLVFVVLACALAYLFGTYLLGRRVAKAMIPVDTNLKRVGVLVVSVVLAGLVGMVPFIGWLATLALLAFGFGALARISVLRRGGTELDPTSPSPLPHAI